MTARLGGKSMGIISIAYDSETQYPDKSTLFRPSIAYPEYLFTDDLCSVSNKVYMQVRDALRMLGLDKDNFGLNCWNPLGDGYVVPGDRVLIKPNLVLDCNSGNGGTDCLYTHPSVVAAIIDYVCIALKGTGEIIIADAPLQTCNFERLIHDSGYSDLVKYYKGKGINIEIQDLRGLTSYKIDHVVHSTINEKTKLSGIIVDLKNLSAHTQLTKKQIEAMRITSYDPAELKRHHNINKHEYLIASVVLHADCIINVPKPKTHRKAGVTIALKNLVGINVRKEYLPHHRVGGSVSGIGDEYLGQSNLRKFSSYFLDLSNKMATKNYYIVAKSLLAMTLIINKIDSLFCSHHNKYAEGSWFGNDTIWRTILDLNRILMYADRNGVITDTPQRKSLCVADMVVIGEGEGPLLPSPRHVGAVAIGENYVCFDEAVATIMGMNFKLIPSIYKPRLFTKDLPIVLENDNTTIVSNNKHWDKQPLDKIKYEDTLQLLPSSGWKGHIELK